MKRLGRKENIDRYYDWYLIRKDIIADEEGQNEILNDYLEVLLNDPQRKAMEIFLKFGTGSVKGYC